MALCDQLTCQLQKLYDLIAGRDIPKGTGINSNGWTWEQRGLKYFYEKTITLGTDPDNQTLDFPNGMALNDVELIFQTAGAPSSNAKTLSIRIYTHPSDGYYSQIRKSTADTNTDIILCGIKLKYGSSARLLIAFSSYTSGDTVKMVVQADDLVGYDGAKA